jgi:hypothetical protein
MSGHAYRERPRFTPLPPPDIEAAVRQGRKVIFVDRDLPTVPPGYTLVPLRYVRGDGQEQHLRVLLPKTVIWYYVNKEGGDDREALDELAAVYDELGREEGRLMVDGHLPNAPQADLAMNTRETYRVRLMNMLLSVAGDGFRDDAIRGLMLDDPYIANRAKAIAALKLGKKPGDLKPAERQDLEAILVHKNAITIMDRERITREKQLAVRCHAGSHWEYKTETCAASSVETVTRREEHSELRGRIQDLEAGIQDYWRMKGRTASPHDLALLREYINLAFIHKEDPAADLDVAPPPCATPPPGPAP